jgi:predicted glycosyltransferase
MDGLGHIMRACRIGKALAEGKDSEPILLTGCSVMDDLRIPSGIAVKRLPAIPRDLFAPGRYKILQERQSQILHFFLEAQPEMALVDTIPLGLYKELQPVLMAAKEGRLRTRFVLGVPYLFGEREMNALQPLEKEAFAAYESALYYSGLGWHGSKDFDDLPLPGPMVGVVAGPCPETAPQSSNVIVVVAGGGTVGASLIEPMLIASEQLRQDGWIVRFIAGPLADLEALRQVIGEAQNFTLVRECPVETAIADAAAVVARCGYNTAGTLVQTNLPLIFIPFEAPTSDQIGRAAALSTLEGIWAIREAGSDWVADLRDALAQAIAMRPFERKLPFSIDGAATAAAEIHKLLHRNPTPTPA